MTAESAEAPRAGLRVLAVDDETPALSELAYLLRADERIATVYTADSAERALRMLQDTAVDGVFLDIRMHGLTGIDLARVLAMFSTPPPVVFVTAHDEHAVDAFELRVLDYVLKPVRPERLAEAVRRVAAHVAAPAASAPDAVPVPDESIPIELGGVTRFISRADVRYVEARGDYARLHTADGGHLIRVPMATLEERWAGAGFVRIHRSYLVALGHVREVRFAPGRASVLVGEEELPVSRRHTRELRDVLVRRSRPGARGPEITGPDISGPEIGE